MDFIFQFLGIISFILSIAFFAMAYIDKKKRNRTIKKKIIIGAIAFAFSGIMVGLYSLNSVKSITIKDINTIKGKETSISILVNPENANNKNQIKCTVTDPYIATINKSKLVSKKEGTTTYSCKIDDIESNVANIKIDLSKEEKEKIAIEKVEKEKKKQEEAEKKKQDEEKEAIANRNKLTTAEAIEIRDNCKALVNQVLKAPSTADYPDSTFNSLGGWQMSKTDEIITVSSYVDSENSFGAQLRSNFTIKFKHSDNAYTAFYFIFNDQLILNQ